MLDNNNDNLILQIIAQQKKKISYFMYIFNVIIVLSTKVETEKKNILTYFLEVM